MRCLIQTEMRHWSHLVESRSLKLCELLVSSGDEGVPNFVGVFYIKEILKEVLLEHLRDYQLTKCLLVMPHLSLLFQHCQSFALLCAEILFLQTILCLIKYCVCASVHVLQRVLWGNKNPIFNISCGHRKFFFF